MATLRPVSPRRLTGQEEAELLEAARRLKAAEDEAGLLLTRRDRLIAELVQAGARVTDVADVLNMSRNAVYAAVERGLSD